MLHAVKVSGDAQSS